MFGYMRPEIAELKVKEYNIFRAHYCGVCHAMKGAGGRKACLALSYDATLLALTGALYSETRAEPARCIGNPFRHVMRQWGEAIDFAAEINIFYGHLKCLDDLADEGSFRGRVGERFLRKSAGNLMKTRPALVETTRKELAQLEILERDGCDQPDLPASASGRALAEAFAALPGTARDEEALRWLGLHVGRFVYFCDAIEDALEDEKAGRYNPFLSVYGSAEAALAQKAELEMLLYYSIGEAEKALDLLRERSLKTILRNIIVEHGSRLTQRLLSGREEEKPKKGFRHQRIPRTLL